MTRKAILQIGTEKTGTTSLQGFLAANRDRLAARGFLYPRFCGELNHTGLAAYAMDADRPDPLKAPFGGASPEAVPQMRERLRKLAGAELTGNHTAIFCSEHCHSRLETADEVWRLRDFLADFFDEIQISVYLRRQDRVALSLYSTMLKSGAQPERVLAGVRDISPYFNYDRFLGLWEGVFGRDAISVRLFEPDLLVNRSVVDDFVATWGLGPIGEFRKVANENGSISLEAQEFLRLVNPLIDDQSGPTEARLRGVVVSTLERGHPGHGARPSRAEARAFYERFRPANERVAQRYFPGRDPLFSEDFGSYPELADVRGTDPETVAGIAAELLRDAALRIDSLEAEISIRDAVIAWRDERHSLAVGRIRAAIARLPGHAGLHRTLGEYLLRLRQTPEAVSAAEAACVRAPENAEYWHFLGIARAAAGDDAGAADAQQTALDLQPDFDGAQEALARAQSRLQTEAAGQG
ncbi:MAG: hypothetical protein KDK10_01860 [Maritimibacter sp.]|nr:hypothetical protein [Maritimibacter sp.]